MAPELHSEDVKLLLGSVTKHSLWHSEYQFQENDWELRACTRKALRKVMIPIHKEPHWVLEKSDDKMVFMMCGMHFDREVHAAGDLSNLFQQGIGSYPQTPRH